MISSAKRYATALFDLAEQAKATDEIGKGLGELAGTWKASEELRTFFQSPQFGLDVKRKVIVALAEKAGAHLLLRNTLALLSDRRRLRSLPDIAEAFDRLSERRSGKVRAEVVSATKLSEDYYAQLQKTLEQATGKKVVLVRREDPTLIGGVVTTVSGRVFDGSIRNRLRELRSRLLHAAEPGLQAGEG